MLFLKDLIQGHTAVAMVLITADSAQVTIEGVRRMIRRNHIRDLLPQMIGIVPRHGYPDVDTTVDLTETIAEVGELLRTAQVAASAARSRSGDRQRVQVRSGGLH